jgi:hypothetical protein
MGTRCDGDLWRQEGVAGTLTMLASPRVPAPTLAPSQRVPM